MSLSVFMNGYLDPSQVALGRLVLDMKNPSQNYCPHNPLTLDATSLSDATFLDLKFLSNVSSSSNFTLLLSKLLKIFAKKSNTTVNDIVTKKATCRQLLNLDLQFARLTKDEDVKRWLEGVVSAGRDVYFVVGLHVLEDASVSLNRGASFEVGGAMQAPITTTISPASTIVPGVHDGLDVRLEGGHTSSSSVGASFVAPGERIIAVQYQKVAFKMLSSTRSKKSLVGAELRGKTRWKSFGAVRGGTDLDVIEAGLEEEVNMEDFEDNDEVKAFDFVGREVFVIMND